MSEDTIILGWDAAWTETGSGAWSVVQIRARKPKVLLVESTPREWNALQQRLQELIQSFSPSLVAIDMPIGKTPVMTYREADRATTKAFSAYGCPVHSPTKDRPGIWGNQLVEELGYHGFEVGTKTPLPKKAVVEVYPHTALLHLLRLSYRFPYKIGRAGSYWQNVSSAEGQVLVRKNLRRLLTKLSTHLDLSDLEFSFPPERPLRLCKEFEDQLDSLVCSWVGVQILNHSFIPYGNEDAAIWNPELNRLDPPKRGS